MRGRECKEACLIPSSMAYISASFCEETQKGVCTVVANWESRNAETKNLWEKGAASTYNGIKVLGGSEGRGRGKMKPCRKDESKKENVRNGNTVVRGEKVSKH